MDVVQAEDQLGFTVKKGMWEPGFEELGFGEKIEADVSVGKTDFRYLHQVPMESDRWLELWY